MHEIYISKQITLFALPAQDEMLGVNNRDLRTGHAVTLPVQELVGNNVVNGDTPTVGGDYAAQLATSKKALQTKCLFASDWPSENQ